MAPKPLDPYRFELVFSGLCAFVLENDGATALMVNAADRTRFDNDGDLTGKNIKLPAPHFPQLSFSMRERIAYGYAARKPDFVTSGPGGEEIGICDITGEDIAIELGSSPVFEPGPLTEAVAMDSLSEGTLNPLCKGTLPNDCVASRVQVPGGRLEVLSISSAGTKDLLIDLRPLRTKGTSSGQPDRTIADRLVLSIDGLTSPIKIRSDKRKDVRLRPEKGGGAIVRASIANYHRTYHPPDVVSVDFLWLYELLEFADPQSRPSRLDLPVPVYRNGTGPFTGSSGVCPPVTFT